MTPPLNFYIYDLEVFPNCFLFGGKFEDNAGVYIFEISERKNQLQDLLNHLSYLQNAQALLTGYNNIGFDYEITHDLLNNVHTFDFHRAFQICKQIIGSNSYGFGNVSHRDRIIPQLDLMKINHFDNANKRTSLKALQFAMRSRSVEDLPFEPETILTSEQIDILIKYNIHDLTETELFLKKCKHHIQIRKDLIDQGVLKGDVLNFSDVKLGTEFLISKIGRTKCFSGNKPIQTFREKIEFKDVVLDKIWYRTEPFQAVLDWFKKQVIYVKSEDELPKLEATLAGLKFHFGVGGLHASVEGKRFESSETHVIRDVDVSGMYPAIAVANGFFPEHLGQDFVTAYRQLQIDRHQYPKGTPMNLILKLAGNGVFGNSDNAYSCFYDPKFPKQITVNGQLQLLQLAESLSLIPGVQLIQANTDGITAYVPRDKEALFDMWCKEWEKETLLKLEYVDGQRMWIRDVNNYLFIDTKGKIKAKGAYWFPKSPEDYWGGSGSVWNKDFSMMVVQKVIEQVLINGWNPEALVKIMDDPFDFMIRAKTPSSATIYIGDKKMPKTIRYYVSTKGEPMKKVSKPTGDIGDFKRRQKLTDSFYAKIKSEIPPNTWDERIHTANKKRYEENVTGIEVGRLVKCCNNISDFDWKDLDYDYYIKEIEKLFIGDSNGP
jgi:hypothetical protein